jgi:hypothetical protein
MRYYSLFFVIILFAAHTKGQDLFLLKKGELSVDFLKSNARCIDKVDILKSREIVAALNLDVFDYFQIESEYDTDLKKKVYMETEDFKGKYEELKKVKKETESTFYYLQINPLFKGHIYHKGEYSLKDKGFFIRTCWSDDYDFLHKIDDNYIYFTTFPSKIKSETNYGEIVKWEEFFVPMTEENAIKIENEPSSFSYVIIFKINGIQKVKWANEFSDGTIILPRADKLRLLIIENETQDIYFDNMY